MATKTVVELVDDLTGEAGEGVETVTFGLDGASYEIDLDEQNAADLRGELEAYIGHARRVGGRAQRGRGRSTASSSVAVGGRSREQNQNIRDWAKKQGLQVAERGRIPAEIVEKYDAAHR